MNIKQTKSGWIIKDSNGEVHRRIYMSARRANEALEGILQGIYRFEPVKASQIKYNSNGL